MNPNPPINGTRAVHPLHLCPNPRETNGNPMPETTTPDTTGPEARELPVVREIRPGVKVLFRPGDSDRFRRIPPTEMRGWLHRREMTEYVVNGIVLIGWALFAWGVAGIFRGDVEWVTGLVPYAAALVAVMVIAMVVENQLLSRYVWGQVKGDQR
jgi:hypothetical protein